MRHLSQIEDASRRRFLGYVIAAPTLVTAARLVNVGPASAAPAAPAQIPGVGVQPAQGYDLIDFLKDAATPTALPVFITIQINTDGTVVFDMHRTEVGQGLTTSVAMIIAEEIGVPLEQVSITLADARPELLFNQLTGGSNSIYTLYDSVRTAAAVARGRLLEAAAAQFGGVASKLEIVEGFVKAPDGSSVGIGDLAESAASLVTEAAGGTPKDAGEFSLIGTPRRRVDARAIVTGAQKYTMDLAIPDAKPTMIARPPTILGTPAAVNNSAAVRALPGVLGVAVIESGVAIQAETFGQCIDALQVIDVTWNDGPSATMTDESVNAQLAAAELPQLAPDLSLLDGLGLDALGDIVPDTIDGIFTFAFQPNCPLEPNPCIADVRGGKAEIWAPMKNPIAAQGDIAAALGFNQGDVTCHVVQAGGSFGRDLFWDAPREAALASQALGVPVKLAWTRTDDFRQGRAHPACRSNVRLLHAAGEVVAYSQNHTSVNTDFGHGLGDALTALAERLPSNLGNVTFSQTVWLLTQYVPYNFGLASQLLNETLPLPLGAATLPNLGDPTTLVEPETKNDIFRTGSMRNIYSPNVVTAREVMIDELCAELDVDPLAFRLARLKDSRSKGVLAKVGEAGEWGRSMAAGTAQGLGFHSEYKGRAACLIEIDTRPATVNRTVAAEYAFTGPRVTKAIFAVDVGLCINPLGLEAQMIGGMMDGIANALSFSLHLGGQDRTGASFTGAYAEDSWEHAYYTRQWNVPFEVEVHILNTDGLSRPGGAGEFGVAASMAAAATAYARATGEQIRTFPVNHDMALADNISPPGTIPQSRTDGKSGVVNQEF